MESTRGVCTSCGRAVTLPHECSPEIVRLVEIDNEAGSRTIREAMIALGKKGFNNKIETLENEAIGLRAKIKADADAREAAKLAERNAVEAEVVAEKPDVDESV